MCLSPAERDGPGSSWPTTSTFRRWRSRPSTRSVPSRRWTTCANSSLATGPTSTHAERHRDLVASVDPFAGHRQEAQTLVHAARDGVVDRDPQRDDTCLPVACPVESGGDKGPGQPVPAGGGIEP